MPTAYVVLLVANLVYATALRRRPASSSSDVGPATLALVRLVIGSLILVPLAPGAAWRRAKLSRERPLAPGC